MVLNYAKQDILNDLKINYPVYEKYYRKSDKVWFQNYFQKTKGLQSSKIECEDIALNMDEDYNVSDTKNIKILYTALKSIPVSNASDERLWSGLAHDAFWDYVQYRRKEELTSGSEMDVKNTYFFMRGTRRSLHIQCLSRLWWAGHLSYDDTRDNPFELTELLSKRAFASNILLFSSSNFTANRELALGILSSIKKREENGEQIKREHFVESTKYLNKMGAVTILDFLERKQIENLVDDLFHDMIDKKKLF